MRLILPSLVALALFAAPPAAACSPVPGYRVPTNMELIEQADLILLATVSAGDFEPDSTPEQQIALTPVEALKGAMPDGPLAITGNIATQDEALLSNPYDLQYAHPQSIMGSCNRYSFPSGSRVLFFLTWEGDHWREAGGPMSRWAEDVLTDDAPWLQVVRFYLKVQTLPEAARAAALAERRASLGGLYDDPVAQLIAQDIDRQLAGPNPPLRAEFGFEGNGMATDLTADDIEAAAQAAEAAAEAAEAAAAAAAERAD